MCCWAFGRPAAGELLLNMLGMLGAACKVCLLMSSSLLQCLLGGRGFKGVAGQHNKSGRILGALQGQSCSATGAPVLKVHLM